MVVRADVPGERLGSIYVPDVARRQPLVGEVVLVGDGCTEVKAGDRVMWGHNAWSRFNAEGYGYPYMLVLERSLLCVLS